MAGSLPHYKLGPDSYQVSALVAGGTLVIADSSGNTVSTAGAGALNVLGVAGNDASPIVSQAGTTTAYGDTLVDISVLPDYVAVYHGADMHVTYAANAAFGQLLKAAANGQVSALVAGGTLVIADSSGNTVSTAGAGALNVLGVAGNDASPIVSQAGTTTAYGDTLVDISVLPDYVAV